MIKALADRLNPCSLVQILGQESVGKTRFVQEVCSYFYRHKKFTYIIMVKDLSQIETLEEFRELMDLLNR